MQHPALARISIPTDHRCCDLRASSLPPIMSSGWIGPANLTCPYHVQEILRASTLSDLHKQFVHHTIDCCWRLLVSNMICEWKEWTNHDGCGRNVDAEAAAIFEWSKVLSHLAISLGSASVPFETLCKVARASTIGLIFVLRHSCSSHRRLMMDSGMGSTIWNCL